MMKRLFTFLFSLLALLWAVPQETWADDDISYYVLGDISHFGSDSWKNPSNPWYDNKTQMESKGDDYYVFTYKCTSVLHSGETNEGKAFFRFLQVKGNDKVQAGPSTVPTENELLNENTEIQSGQNTSKAFYFPAEKDHNYKVIINHGSWKVKYYEEKAGIYTYHLIGGIYPNDDDAQGTWHETDWKVSDTYKFGTYSNGAYTLKFTADQTGTLRFRIATDYLPSKSSKNNGAVDLCPDVTKTSATSSASDVAYTDYYVNKQYPKEENYWTYNVENGKTYVFTLSEAYDVETEAYTRKISVAEEGSEVKTPISIITDGGTTVTSTENGTLSYTYTPSADAKIKVTIDNVAYGLAEDAVVSEAGTTNYEFNTSGEGYLTLTANLTYQITVTKDGKMTVVATKKSEVVKADQGYYLVGDFFHTANDGVHNPGGDSSIAYDKLYFKFMEQGDGRYMVEIPASLTAHMQVLGVDEDGNKTAYGPSAITQLHGAAINGAPWPLANDSVGTSKTETAYLVKLASCDPTKNYWDLLTRNDGAGTELSDDDGLYAVYLTFTDDGNIAWTIKHDAYRHVSYFLSKASNATAQPFYTTRKNLGSAFGNDARGIVHIDAQNNEYYIVDNTIVSADYVGEAQQIEKSVHENRKRDVLPTYSKLFYLGNGGINFAATSPENQMRPNLDAFKIEGTGNYIGRYNSSQGNQNLRVNALVGELLFASGTKKDYPEAISMVGPAIAGTTSTVGETTKWNWTSTAGDMTYDESDRCYKLVLNTSESDLKKTFRFVGDHQFTYNWYEDETKARVPFDDENAEGHAATIAEPNYANYTSSETEETITHDDNTDIIWNRPAGLWTVRFYIDAVSNSDQAVFRYTITGAKKIDVPVVKHRQGLLRTYTSASDVVPVNKDVLIYAAQSYEKTDKEILSGDETGTVKLYQLKYIPANTGVILYAPNTELTNGTSTKIEVVGATKETVNLYNGVGGSAEGYYFKDWASATDKTVIWKNNHTGESWNNYLIGVLENTSITQFYYDEANNWTGRNFAFTMYSNTATGKKNGVNTDDDNDYYSFFRGRGTVKASYAYLMLPKTVMENNGQILSQEQDLQNPLFAKSMAWFEGIDAPWDNGGTTGIYEVKKADNHSEDAYYTLQGMKVAKPTKGLYIHNGKKIVVE